jgi:UDP-N-acetylmuramoyl-L-alanyl-D-glutamate--2,6-diaminopimelate ligase
VQDAAARGAVGVVCARGQGAAICAQVPGAAVAEVGDVNRACALLAHEVAGNPTAGMKVIGVTGTKGKTTVAYLLRSVLKAAGKKVGMIGTVEIDDGERVVPAEMTTPGAVELVELFSRMRGNGVTHCVMEVSSHALHQQRTAGIDFAVGIFTNLTGDHLDYHGTMEEYGAAKALLFQGLKPEATAVVNVNDAWASQMVHDCRAKVVGFGFRQDPMIGLGPNCWTGRTVGWSIEHMEMEVQRPGGSGWNLLTSPLVGKHNAYNLLSVIAAATSLGIPEQQVFETLKRAAGAPGRLQRVMGERSTAFQVFVDYAHTHDALANVLSALRLTAGGNIGGTPMPRGRLICVFGCGGDRDRTKRPKMGRIAEALADRVIVTSDNPRTEGPGGIIEEICAGFSEGWREAGKISVEADRRAAIRMAIEMAEAGDVVLIAGKGHENYQIIGTTKHHFDDVEEAAAAMAEREKLSTNAHE